MSATGRQVVLRVDPLRCGAHGVCAQELPEAIALDEWGYPILPDDPIPAEFRRRVRAAVRACPALALRVLPLDGG
jgi:ferredoxin